ncbi:MAG: ester cyclase [Caldilineaceae bacterium]
MKTHLLGSLLLSYIMLLAACQPIRPNSDVTPAAPLTATEQRNLAVVQKLYAGLGQGDSKVVLDLYAEQYTEHFSGQTGQMARRQAADEQSVLRLSLPDLHTEIVSMFAQGDLVVTEMIWTASLHGDFLGTPTTSPQSRHRGLIVRRLEAGKIVEEWDLFDNLSLLQSLGYLPAFEQIVAHGPSVAPTRPPAPADAVFELNPANLTNQERWQQNLVKELYEAYANGNSEVIGETYAPHVQIHQAGQVKTTTAAQLQQEFAAAKQANPTLQPMVHSLAVHGELVIVEMTWLGAHTGLYLGIPVTGRTIVRDGLIIYRLHNDKIAEVWEMWEDLGFLQSVGYLSSWNNIVALGSSQDDRARATK